MVQCHDGSPAPYEGQGLQHMTYIEQVQLLVSDLFEANTNIIKLFVEENDYVC